MRTKNGNSATDYYNNSFLEDLNFDDICMISNNCYTVQHTEKTGELNEMVNDIGLKARKNHYIELHFYKANYIGRNSIEEAEYFNYMYPSSIISNNNELKNKSKRRKMGLLSVTGNL